MKNLIYIFIGGGAGSLLRFGVSEFVKRNFQFAFPAATFCSNLLSCLVLALAIGVFREKMTANFSLQYLLIAGFCGGLSTFSTFSFETVNLIKEGQAGIAFANITISIVVCFSIIYFLAKNS